MMFSGGAKSTLAATVPIARMLVLLLALLAGSSRSAYADADCSAVVANLVQTCGFENPVVYNQPTNVYPGAFGFAYLNNSTVSGWTYSGAAGLSGNGSGFQMNNPPSPQGLQVAFLQGFGASVAQDITFPTGGSYQLTFQAAQRATRSSGGPVNLAPQDFYVSLDGVQQGDNITPPGLATGAYSSYSRLLTGTAGLHRLKLTSLNTAGGDNTAFIDNLAIVRIDTTPPVTTASLAGTRGNNGWFVGPVTVTLNATDDPGGSGVASTTYSLDGAALQLYTVPFTVSADGVHSLSFESQDRAGNVEQVKTASVKIDQTGPQTTAVPAPGTSLPGLPVVELTATAAVSSPTGAPLGVLAVRCWSTPGLIVTLNAADNPSGSGVASITYAATGAQPISSTTVAGAVAPVSVTSPGLTTLTYAAIDQAGNQEVLRSETIVVGVDEYGSGLGCAAATPSTAPLPTHGTLLLTGTATSSGQSIPFTHTIKF